MCIIEYNGATPKKIAEKPGDIPSQDINLFRS